MQRPLGLSARAHLAPVGLAGNEAQQEIKKEVVSFREVRCLLLSYQNILKMNNLVGFDKLLKLQLDNNIIEKIENLSHLRSGCGLGLG